MYAQLTSHPNNDMQENFHQLNCMNVHLNNKKPDLLVTVKRGLLNLNKTKDLLQATDVRNYIQ